MFVKHFKIENDVNKSMYFMILNVNTYFYILLGWIYKT